MNPIQRFKNSYRQNGWMALFIKLYIELNELYFDFIYGLDTNSRIKLEDLTIESKNVDGNRHYEPTRVIPLKKLFNSIKPMIPPNSSFVDLGCGKGRVLLVASQFGFKEIIGVEFAHELCESARDNCTNYIAKTGSRTRFQIIQSDVVDYVFGTGGCVLFMYNPFDKVVLKKILDNIVSTPSVQGHRGRTLIIYHNPIYDNLIEQHESFKKVEDFGFWGYTFAVYLYEDRLGQTRRTSRR